MAFWDKWGFSRFSPEKLKERAEEVLGKELELSEREAKVAARERIAETNRTAESEIQNTNQSVKDAKNKAEMDKLKLAHETSKDEALADANKTIAKMEAEAELKDTVHEQEKENLEAAAKADTELASVKNATIVSLETKKSVDTQIDERKKTLGYVQENIDSLLARKDGIIEGQKIAMDVYKSQLEYMQNVLAVAVGKIPTVNLNDFKINVEMPPTTPQKGGGDKGGNQGGEKKN